MPDSRSTNLKKWAYALFIVCFISFWLTFMIVGLTAAACRKDRFQGEKKLAYCSISLAAGFWADRFKLERAKRSILHLERGIALSQLSREEEARIEFNQTIIDATIKNGPWDDRLIARISQFQDTRARTIQPGSRK